jgi:hypothetical protein
MEMEIMKIVWKFALVTLVGCLIITASAPRAFAQKSESVGAAIQPFAVAASPEDAAAAQTPAAPAPPKAATDPADGWHFSVTPYLWFAGMHGTVGANGHDVSVHAGFSDIFSHLNIGLMGAAEPQYKKFGAPVDFLWMKLSDDKGLPFERGPSSIKAKVNQTMLAPKVAYRLIDGEMVKVDGNFGIRYFHLGTTLDFVGTGPHPAFTNRKIGWTTPVAQGSRQHSLPGSWSRSSATWARAVRIWITRSVAPWDISSSRALSCRPAGATWM